jgi:hypothetical protein
MREAPALSGSCLWDIRGKRLKSLDDVLDAHYVFFLDRSSTTLDAEYKVAKINTRFLDGCKQ